MEKLRIGMIGAGRIGKLHGNNLSRISSVELVTIADPYLTDEAKAWAEGLGVKNITLDPEDIFRDPDIDVVFICSSTATHADFIVKAAEAGKNIFCEKPLDFEIDKINKALDAVKKAGVKLQVGFVRRFDHNHKKVHDTVASGMLGAPHIIKVCSRDPECAPAPYMATSGGIHIDMTIHDFDMARYLAGSEVTEVMAYGALLIEPDLAQYGDVDTTIIMLKFENGALGVIDNSRAARYGYDQRTEVHCAKGCVQVSNDLIDTSMISTAEGVYCEKPTWFFLERYNDAFIKEVNDFVDAIQNDKDVPVTGLDGLMSVAIAKAAKKSMDENRPVKLSEILK